MFKLFKLAILGLVGYSVYQLYLIFSQGIQGQGQGQTSMSPDLEKATQEDTGRMMNLTGTGRGTTESTAEASGQSVPHVVGRGVIS